jgi:hypothetical protein
LINNSNIIRPYNLKEYELHFNYKDIFLAPRLALSPKKIWVLIIGNLSGFILYWISSYISLILSGVEINDAFADYGLYPFLFGSSAPIISWIIYYSGLLIWLSFILASCAGVSRITLKATFRWIIFIQLMVQLIM